MINTALAIVVMACLFVIFGAFKLADGKSCDGGCIGCSHDCANLIDRRPK